MSNRQQRKEVSKVHGENIQLRRELMETRQVLNTTKTSVEDARNLATMEEELVDYQWDKLEHMVDVRQSIRAPWNLNQDLLAVQKEIKKVRL